LSVHSILQITTLFVCRNCRFGELPRLRGLTQPSRASDLRGFGDLDDSNIPVALSCELDFSGVIVVPNNLEPKPADAPQARITVEPFLNTAELQQPRWDRFRYLLAPRS
jgi:hypothetical protein